MSEQLDKVLQQMQELTETVKEHKADPATLDFEEVKKAFSAQIDELAEQKAQEKMDSKPQRRIPGNAVGVGDMAESVPSRNRYAKMLKSFGRDGYHQIGTLKAQPLDLWLAHRLLAKGHDLMPDRVQAPSEDLKAAIKAMTSDGSGTGDELVPTNMAASLWEDFFLASRIAGQFTTIDMPTNPFDVPLGLGDTTWRKGSENTATTATDLTTAKSTLTATELVTEVNWSYTLAEDSIVALMPAVRSRLAISGAEVIDSFMLNADSTDAATGNINLDDADPAADSYYLSAGQDGIRHLWIADNTSQAIDAGGDALADSDVLNALDAMGKYAVNPEQVIIIADASTYLKGLLGATNVRTVDKYGPGATILTGELARYSGVPIIVSASAPLTQSDAKCSTTSGNNTLGQLSLVNRNMWYVGFRRNLLIEVDRDIQRRQYIMVVSLREAVAAHGTRASATHTAGVYNILV